MGLTWRQRFVLKLRMRYKVKRVYFTLLIPCIIALVIMSIAFYSGFSPIPSIGPVQSSAANTAALTKLQEFEQLFPNATVNGKSISAVAGKAGAAAANPHNFDYVLVASLLVAFAPYSIDITMKDRLYRRQEQDFADFLFELSELVRGGIDPIKAMITLSQGNVGSITKEVKMVAKQMQIGYTFEQSMKNLALSLRSPLIDKYVDLVVQASYSGGSVANLIQRAAADMSTFLSIDREKRAGLAQYTVILYTAQVVLIALCAIMVVQFLPDLSSISALGGAGLAGILGNPDIQNVNLERDLFYLIMINGFLGGLVIGKISESSIRHGIKHALILVLIGFLAWTIFVVPATGATAHYDLKVVSYDATGIADFPLQDPVVVQVNETNGSPAVGVLVQFAISGPGGGGTVTPTSLDTDSNGQATTTVVLGNDTGIYNVAITVGTNSTAVEITATSGGLPGLSS